MEIVRHRDADKKRQKLYRMIYKQIEINQRDREIGTNKERNRARKN